MINKPPPLNRDYNWDPSIKARKRGRFIDHGSALATFNFVSSGAQLIISRLGFGASGLGCSVRV